MLATEQALAPDSKAEAHEIKVQTELNAQFLELKRQAQGVFDAVKGRRGARTAEIWQEAFVAARIDYASGKFLMERLGADRHLDHPLVATLTQMRAELLSGIPDASIRDHMLADSAIIAYRNLLRVQGWRGSLCLQIERELFGQRSLDSALDELAAAEVARQIDQIQHSLMPLLDRGQRMLLRALDRLEARGSRNAASMFSVGIDTRVTVAGFSEQLNRPADS